MTTESDSSVTEMLDAHKAAVSDYCHAKYFSGDAQVSLSADDVIKAQRAIESYVSVLKERIKDLEREISASSTGTGK